MKDIAQIQAEIFEEINDPEKKIHLQVSRKKIEKESYLEGIRNRCIREGATEEEADDVTLLVEKALWGFGVLDELIADPDISDIRMVDENTIRIKEKGVRKPTDISFESEKEYDNYIQFITNRNATNISIVNAAQVFTDKDSCKTDILRFSLCSKQVNTNERDTLLIRKIPKIKKDFERLISDHFMTKKQELYLTDRWRDGHGMLVCGPNGSGKTTLTNAILEATPHEKSAVVIQESEELFCHTHPEMVFRKVIPPKNGSIVSYSLKDLARLALMESFDIMVIGEMKGDEAADLSYATYTGSQAMTTVHSNSAPEAYEKVIDYGLDAQPNRSKEHFAKQLQSLDTVVFVKNYHITEIYENNGWDGKEERYHLTPIYVEGKIDNLNEDGSVRGREPKMSSISQAVHQPASFTEVANPQMGTDSDHRLY